MFRGQSELCSWYSSWRRVELLKLAYSLGFSILNLRTYMTIPDYVWSTSSNKWVLQNSERWLTYISESVVSSWAVSKIWAPTKGRPFIDVQSLARPPWSGTVEWNRNALIPQYSSTRTYDLRKRAYIRPNLSSWKFVVLTGQVTREYMPSHRVKYCLK